MTDSLDRVLDALSSLQTSVSELRTEVVQVRANVDQMQRSVQHLREDHFRRVGALEERVEVTEERQGSTLREAREAKREARESDGAIQNEQAGLLITVEETRKEVKQSLAVATAALAATRVIQKSATTVAVETTAQTPMIRSVQTQLQQVDVDVRKPKVVATLAALVNLVIALAYAILEYEKYRPR